MGVVVSGIGGVSGGADSVHGGGGGGGVGLEEIKIRCRWKIKWMKKIKKCFWWTM